MSAGPLGTRPCRPPIVCSMATGDTRDWSFVLLRPCPECGFDSRSCPKEAVAALLRENADAWRELLLAGAIGPGRPGEESWSSLEYACHVRDVIRRIEGRIDLMLNHDDPVFAVWDQDAAAVDGHYEDQDPAVVVSELESDAHALADRLGALAPEAWGRPGRRGTEHLSPSPASPPT